MSAAQNTIEVSSEPVSLGEPAPGFFQPRHIDDDQLAELNEQFETMAASQVIAWAVTAAWAYADTAPAVWSRRVPSGERMASVPISAPVESRTARCMVFSSSRTLPGQRPATIWRLASAESGRAGTPLVSAYLAMQ